jgi:hypothetical protein
LRFNHLMLHMYSCCCCTFLRFYLLLHIPGNLPAAATAVSASASAFASVSVSVSVSNWQLHVKFTQAKAEVDFTFGIDSRQMKEPSEQKPHDCVQEEGKWGERHLWEKVACWACASDVLGAQK